MKRIFILFLLSLPLVAMENPREAQDKALSNAPAFAPQPSLGGLPTDLRNIIFNNVIKRDPSVPPTQENMEKAARDLKSFLLTNKQFAGFANDERINSIIIAFGNNWTDDHFTIAARALLKAQPFESSNKELADQINRRITVWLSKYIDFSYAIKNSRWDKVSYYLKLGLPIHDEVRDVLISNMSQDAKDRIFAKLIQLGVDPQIIFKLKQQYREAFQQRGRAFRQVTHLEYIGGGQVMDEYGYIREM